jgi:hypothetical protein
MNTHLKEFDFEKTPMRIKYFEKEPLKLNSELTFFHNKSKFRKELTRLQNLIKKYTNSPLHAAGIRDTYLKEEFFEKFLIVIFTDSKIVKNTTKIIEKHSQLVLNSGCFYIENTSEYMLLLASEIDGLKAGIDSMENILMQVLEEYMNQKNFDDFVKISAFELMDCVKK